MTILQRMCSHDDPDRETRGPRPARIVKSRRLSTKGKEPAASQARKPEPEPSQQLKTAGREHPRTPDREQPKTAGREHPRTPDREQPKTAGREHPKTPDREQPKAAPARADTDKSIGELFSPTRPNLRARLSSWSIRQRAQTYTAEAIPDMPNNMPFLKRRASAPMRPDTPAHDPESVPEVRPTLRTRISAWSIHQRAGEGLANFKVVSPAYGTYFPTGRLVVG